MKILTPTQMLRQMGFKAERSAEKVIVQAMEFYGEQQADLTQELFTKPQQQLKPLEELWRQENSPNEFVIPDATLFFKWITDKLINQRSYAAEIGTLVKARNKYLDSGNEKVADELESDVRKEFRDNSSNYPVDFIIETLTEFGDAPQLVYDDNGLFAVTGDGHSPVVSGEDKIKGVMHAYVEEEQWFPTIREALNHYMNER